MPIRKDETGKHWVEMELLLPGTPEQVWHAVATGPGNAAWFTRGEIEPRVGGAFSLDFGGGATTMGEVTAWDPPHQFGYVERDWAEGAPPVATEITITGRAGNQCVLRMVHSLFTTSDDWDDQMEGFESGWPGFFAVLRLYLGHFAGAEAASFMAVAPTAGESLPTWRKLIEDLGLTGADVGDRRTGVGPEGLSGQVAHIHQDGVQRYVLLRITDPTPGVLLAGTYDKSAKETGGEGGTNVSVLRYFYGDDAAAVAAIRESKWRDWLNASHDDGGEAD
ncbi:SRPBCC domain-containing protein [Sphingomonas sp.]|uniref:SRPBCC domain-containing protein n=1 Tax=Sphingomonas sp. TaxID=28214 RepID=UPI003D6D176F